MKKLKASFTDFLRPKSSEKPEKKRAFSMKKQARTTLSRILKILSDGFYHDGEEMGRELNISRAGIWKTIQKLQKYNIKIDAIKNKGYALQEPFILLDEAYLQKNLISQDIPVEIFESIASTQSYLKSVSSSTSRICLAEEQKKGRGRCHRDWHSPFGQNLYMSLSYPFQKDVSELSVLSLIASLSVLKGCSFFFKKDLPLSLKWPNDILIKNQKIGGVLVEIQGESHGLASTIIGVGLNVNMNPTICSQWSSLQKIHKFYIDRNELALLLLNTLLKDLEIFNKTGFGPFLKEWQKFDSLYDHSVKLSLKNEDVFGIAKGVNEFGHLLLENPEGVVTSHCWGDLSRIRKSPSTETISSK